MMDLRQPFTQSLGWATTLQSSGWAIVMCGRALAAIRQGKHGLYVRFQRATELDLRAIADLKAQTSAGRVFIEPDHAVRLRDDTGGVRSLDFGALGEPDFVAPLTAAGWTRSAQVIAGTKTRIVPLVSDADAQLASFSSATRRNVRRAMDRGQVDYEVVPFDDLTAPVIAQVEALYRAFIATRPQLDDEWRFRATLKERYGPGGDLVLARRDGALLGVIYLLRHDRVATYYAAFSSPVARGLRVPSGLTWTAMRHATALGCDQLDFYGVADERYPERTRSWQGFTTFKERFGGHARYYPPSFDA